MASGMLASMAPPNATCGAPSLGQAPPRPLHGAIDAETLEVQAVEVTGAGVGDPTMLPELLEQIPTDQDIGSVTADGAYDTRKCHDVIADCGADAIIPPRKNAKPWKPTTQGAITRNEALRACKRFSRSVWKRWSKYHRRSLAETKMNCVKRLGQGIMAREFGRQVAKLQIRTSILNRFTALGTPETIAGQRT